VPTYDYQCRSCGVITEVVHSMLDDGPTTCERCGGELRHVIHPTGIIFKGGGFYKTDSRSSPSASAGGSAGSGSGDGGAPATSTTEKAKTDTGSTPRSKPSGSGAGKSEGGGD
jgi:putative FmdB family regulatory protein